MSRVDLVLIGCVLPFVLRGLWRGFVREAIALAGLLLGAVLAMRAARPAADLLQRQLGFQLEPALVVGAAGIFLAVMVAAAILGRLARRLASAVFLGPLDRIAGGALGLAQGAAIVGLACLGVQRLAPESPTAAEVEQSRVGPPLVVLAERLVEAARPFAPLAVGQQV